VNTLIKSSIGLSSFSAYEKAVQTRDRLCSMLKAVTVVKDSLTQDRVVALAVDGRKFIKMVEAERKEATKPLDAYKAAAIDLERELTGPIQAEMDRVALHITAFQQIEQQRVAELNRTRQIEIERQEAEMLARNAQARTVAGGIQTEADLQAAIEAEMLAKAQQEAWRATVVAPEPVVNKASGSITRKTVQFEVTDIAALYKARPELVRLEFNAGAARALIVAVPKEPIPGLIVTETTVTGFRAR
jgi:hypothetical protein